MQHTGINRLIKVMESIKYALTLMLYVLIPQEYIPVGCFQLPQLVKPLA